MYAGVLTLDSSASTTASREKTTDVSPLLAEEKKWPVAFGKQAIAERKGTDEPQDWTVPELYITGHNGARVLTAALAVGIVLGVVFWAREARSRFDVPSLVCDGCAPADWFRWTQLLLAVIGIAAALVVVVYMAHFTAHEVVWRRWRGASITFGVLAGAWTVLWWLDYLWI